MCSWAPSLTGHQPLKIYHWEVRGSAYLWSILLACYLDRSWSSPRIVPGLSLNSIVKLNLNKKWTSGLWKYRLHRNNYYAIRLCRAFYLKKSTSSILFSAWKRSTHPPAAIPTYLAKIAKVSGRTKIWMTAQSSWWKRISIRVSKAGAGRTPPTHYKRAIWSCDLAIHCSSKR